jgi:hypothetical protein
MKAEDEPKFPEIFEDVTNWMHTRGDGTAKSAVAAASHADEGTPRQRRLSARKKRI